MTETFYDVLGVSTDASTAAIEAAYREQLKQTHPDVSDAADAGEATQRLIEARDVLTDEDERARYDRLGHDAYVAGESTAPENDAGSDVAEAARRAGYDDSASATNRTEPNANEGSRSDARERARRERAARERVTEDRRQRSTANTEASADTGQSTDGTSETATASETESTWDSGATATTGFSDSSASATWNSSSSYSVRQTDTVSSGSLLEMPTGRELTLFAITFALYPVMLFSALLPAFPLWVNAIIGLCTLFMVGYLQSEPTIAIMVFGSWSLTTPVLLLTLNISAFSLVGALALSGTWLPFGFSLLTASVLRL